MPIPGLPTRFKKITTGRFTTMKTDLNTKAQVVLLISVLIPLEQLCPIQMAYWAKNHVTISTRVAHFMTY